MRAKCNFSLVVTLQTKRDFMKKKIMLLLLMSLALQAVDAQQEKSIVRDANVQVRPLAGFTSIEVSGAISLYLSQGTEDAVAVSAGSDEAVNRIRTELKGGVLRIYADSRGNWRGWGNTKMKAYVTFKNLRRVEASGACNVKLADAIKLNDLELEMSGASDFSGKLSVALLKLTASGASQISITGSAGKTQVEASGASDIKAYDLETDFCKLNASGGSVIRIQVNKELDANASGGSDVFYKGAGLIRNINTSGGATVKKKNGE